MTAHASAGPPTPAGLARVFLVLRLCVHALVALLALFVVVRAALTLGASAGDIRAVAAIVLSALLLTVYACGRLLRTGHTRILWAAAIALIWCALAVCTADAAFLAFPLFFVLLHALPMPWNIAAVGAMTVVAIVTLALHLGWSVGGVLGPLIGAAVATVMGLGYQTLDRQAREQERLIVQLVATRDRLAAAEREAGVLGERTRLARELHDTVAQGLTSIQLLLHAAERTALAPDAHAAVRLARETAAAGLEETRRFIRELRPGLLEERGLVGALTRLGEEVAATSGMPVRVHASAVEASVPPAIEGVLLRVAQGALANVVQHAGASRVDVTLSQLGDEIVLDIVDDGGGFDVAAAVAAAEEGATFGLAVIRARVAEVGGTVSIESRRGEGAALAVSVPLGGSTAAARRETTP